MNHYVYRITNITDNKHYYGARSSKCAPVNDLGIKYFSSSSNKDFIADQKANNTKYKYKIIKIFKHRHHAINFEIKLHKKLNVKSNKAFYNKANQTSTGFDFCGCLTDLDKLNMSKRALEYNKNHPERGKSISHSLKKYFSDPQNKLKKRKIAIEYAKNHPEINIKKSISRLINLNSPDRALLGIFITPLKRYISLPPSVKITEKHTMSHTNVRHWCKNASRKIVIQSIRNNNFLKECDLGKTRKELGFDIIYPKTIEEAMFHSEEIINGINFKKL